MSNAKLIRKNAEAFAAELKKNHAEGRRLEFKSWIGTGGFWVGVETVGAPTRQNPKFAQSFVCSSLAHDDLNAFERIIRELL